MKFYIAGLTEKEILQGKKTTIIDAICDEFHRCVEAVHNNQFSPEDKKQAEIFFENDFTNENFAKQHTKDQDILYVNEVAKKILDKKHISLRIYGEITALPKRTGLIQSVSVYSK